MEAECEEEEVRNGYGDRSTNKSSRIEELLTLDQLEELKEVFAGALSSRNISGKKLSKDEFGQEIKCLLKDTSLELHISRMFSKMGVPDDGLVDWEAFCSYMLAQYFEKDSLKQKTPPFQDLPRIKNMYSKETICRIVSIQGPTRVLTVCKDASVGVWTPSLHFQHGFDASEEEPNVAPLLTGSIKKSRVMVTDCVVMENCSKLVLAVTKRELQFHDIPSNVGTGRTIRVKVFDLPYVPLCLCYHEKSQGGPSTLLYGDENGDVHTLTFANACLHLFVVENRKSRGVTPRISYNMLPEQSPHVLHQVFPGVHTEWVRRIQYLPDNHTIISCSSSQPSLVIKDLMSRQNPYKFRIRKGVECFAYDSDLPLLATGGMDHAVRLWNPYVTAKPVAYLQKHVSTILDLVICRELGLLFSFSQDGVLCAWDLYEHCLIQVIGVKFPFIQRLPDHGARSLFPGFKSRIPSLVATSNEFLAEYELGIPGSYSKTGTVTTDSAPITSALYSPLLSQVVVGSEGSTVTVWDIDTGRKVLHFPHCHGDHEITCMVVDRDGRRFITGTRYGEVKVWNSTTGECLKVLHHAHKTEVTGVVGVADKRQILTVGWNKQVTVFPDDEDSFEARPLEGWEDSGKHDDDILCVSYLHPRFLATGSFDGVIRVWNIENTQLVRQFHSQSISIATFDPSRNLRKASCASFRTGVGSVCSNYFQSRPASRRMSTYKLKLASTQLKRSPIDNVLFLQNRGRSKLSGCGILISSDHGEGSFWDLFGSDEPVGSFPLTLNQDEHVMALATDHQNHHLVAGDTGGSISIFDIRDYCMVSGRHYGHPVVVSSWSAHCAEVTSVQYVDHSTQPLILSASGDATVRLWTLQGHFIGTFGQEKLWNLESPSTFQHPKTPWGEMHLSKSSVSRMSHTSSVSSVSARKSQTGTPGTASPQTKDKLVSPTKEETILETSLSNDRLSEPSSSSFKLPKTLHSSNKDQNTLGQPYRDQLVKRMKGRKERRNVYSGVDLKSTQRFGSLCSPFQALILTSMNDVPSAKQPGMTGIHDNPKQVKMDID